jgi:hypothetical protein
LVNFSEGIRKKMMSKVCLGEKLKLALALVVISASAAVAWVVQPYIVEPIKVSSAHFAKAMEADLDPTGVLVSHDVNGRKESICEMFWAKQISEAPAVASTTAHPQTPNGYGRIRQGALVGIIHLLPEATEDYLEDFENQELKPGYYTMRYAVMQAGIGEHGPLTGDFVVLSPIALDADPAKLLTMEEMVRKGKAASHGHQPARIPLVKAEEFGNSLPEVVTDQDGGGTLHFELKLASAKPQTGQELKMALLVVRPKPDLGGS